MRARVVVGRDGDEVIHLRIDLGVMQMLMAGRPDGQRIHGLPSAREFVEHELRVGGEHLLPSDWQELHRELLQTNYRRLAYAALAEDALQDSDSAATCRFIEGALADIEGCTKILRLIDEHAPNTSSPPSLRPTLLFDQARLAAQLRVVEGQFEEAIEQAEAGAESLETLLGEMGYDDEARDEDPGVRYLLDLGRQLRLEYGVTKTLRERLEEALDHEDFETASEIRDAMARRRQQAGPAEEPPPAE
jgi:hypothetical protein